MDVLVVGASIAGLSAATALGAQGHRLTLVERAGGPRSGGVAIDVRGAALQAARAWGVYDDIYASRITANEAWRFVSEDGEIEAVWHVAEQFYESPEDVELLRDRLVDILRERIADDTEQRFDEHLADLSEDGTGVWATFEGREPERFDLVIGADGLHSTVRRIVFGPELDHLHHLGSYVGLVRNARSLGDLDGTFVFNRPGRVLTVAGGNPQPTAMFAFRSPWLDHDFRDMESHRRLVQDVFAGDDGWRMSEALEELRVTEDFYFDSVAQVRMDSWTRGRVVLVGDAGYGPSFFSGMGSSLAMIGADILSAELERSVDLPAALAAYDRGMREHVDAAQAMALDGMDILFPATQEAIEARNADLRAAAAGA